MKAPSSVPIAWILAGSDSGGGAGMQVDLKTMNAFGVHGCSVVTALTAQNTLGVSRIEDVSVEMLEAQLLALAADSPPQVIKTGMLGSGRACELLLKHLPRHDVPLICDPLLKSSSGEPLIQESTMDSLKTVLFPHVTVLTPNLPEVATLLGSKLPAEQAAEKLLELGPHSILIKGGHAEGNECRDYWTDGIDSMWLSSPRIDTNDTHGTGCLLSSAIASAIALGQSIPEAIITAKTFLNQSLKSPSNIGAGHGPMQIRPFCDAEEDRPEVTTGRP
jgi:hydroxymethylpyrimidine kinase/phosphomethylpyrimidine kinase